jgi:DHA2 family multidrug resistance protein
MTSLYLRGFSLGMIFTPLSTVAIIDIPREKMAQAAGLSNVVRQLGGSFGVAILATLLTTRVNYHSQIYGQSIETNSQSYKNTIVNISYYLQHQAGYAQSKALQLSRSAILSQVNKEAYIQAIDDDFMIAGIVTLLCIIPVFWIHDKKNKNKKVKHETTSE